eukprot:Em0006g1132a
MKTWLGERLTWKMPPKLPSPMLRCSFAQNPVGDENIRRTRMAVIRIKITNGLIYKSSEIAVPGATHLKITISRPGSKPRPQRAPDGHQVVARAKYLTWLTSLCIVSRTSLGSPRPPCSNIPAIVHACISVKAEAGSGLGHELRNTRPADILASNWLCGKPAAFDLTVVSPLNPTFISEAGRTAGSAAVAAELRKHSANDAMCSELGWTCIPLVAESYGAWGSEAVQAFSRLASYLATRTNSPKSKTWHKGTWMHPRSKTLHMIDFVITRQKDRYLMQDTRVYHSVDVWSDHFFVGSSMVMPVSKPHHRVRLNSSINRRFDVSRLSQPEVVMQYQQALTDALHQLPSRATSNETSETLWSSFSKAVINAATNHLGFTSKRPTPDWFYDNLDTIQPMLLRKKQLLGQVLSARKANISVPADLLTQYRSARNHVKYHVHKIQNGWWKHKAEELNHFHIKGDWKNLFSSWKLLSFHRQVHIRSVLDKSGSNVISDPTQIRDRWRSHFNHVLNTTASSYDDSVFNIIPQQPIMEELARPPTVEEVRCALSQVKCNRAAGKDGIPAELLIYGGEQALTFLHTICTEVWSSELIPKEWVDSIIVPLPKKGNLQLCDNWRGISLLSVAGKVFARVLANRITPVAESILDETQCGFRKCRGTIDMIFVARQLQEKAREQMCQLYMCFFDLKKAYDSVPRHALWLLLARLGFPSKLQLVSNRDVY